MEEGKCPKCGHYNLDYGTLEVYGQSVYYPWECPDCKSFGKEWYSLTFDEQELIETEERSED